MAFLGKIRKSELVTLGKELGLSVNDGLKVAEIRKMILGSEDYDEDFVKNLVDTIVKEAEEEKQREIEREKKENEREQRKIELEQKNFEEKEKREHELELEREKRKYELEKEKEKINFELERMKLSLTQTTGDSNGVTFQGPKCNQELHKIIQKFDPKEDEISLYLVIFERQAKKFQIEKKDWVSQLLCLLPSDIVQLISREPEDKGENYEHIKEILLRRFKLSPETFRIKFAQHQKLPQSTWKDFAIELSNFFEEWINGVSATDYSKLKNLIIADQMKKRVSFEVREHFVDCWGKLASPTELADMLDEYENVRRTKKSNGVFQEKKKINFAERSKNFNHKYEDKKSQDSFKNKNELFDKRKTLRCYECGSVNHLRPQCPKLKTARNSANVNRIVEAFEKDEFLAPYTVMSKINGHQMPLLRDTGASIDIVCQKYVKPQMYTGECIWVLQPLDEGPVCLPLAQWR